MALRRLAFVALALIATCACTDDRVEGTQAGDCEDGADNDADGLFDCDDPGCAGSPVCRELPDGGSRDAGAPDAEVSDASATTDSGRRDAGGPDAGGADAGEADAGSDSGPIPSYSVFIPTGPDRLLVTDTSDLYPQEFTYELWTRVDTLSRHDFFVSNNAGYYLFYLRIFSDRLQCVVGSTSCGGLGQCIAEAPLSSLPGFTTGDWHHVACTRASDGTVGLWLDGEQVASVASPVYRAPMPATPLGIGGSHVTPPDSATTFIGYIDEVRISSSALYDTTFTPPRRLALEPDTLALWHFDEGSGTSAADSAMGPRHAASLSTGVTWIAE